jgi:rSAM/selenodomain-associated transferase 1
MQVLILVAKAPLAGFAKTRLVAERGLTAAAAARLADAFLRDTLEACGRIAGASLMVSFAPRESEPYFRELAPRARLVPQVEGDLGARLAAAFEAAFELGATRAVALGSDTPHVGAGRIARALAVLEASDCVLGPAVDGGYYLIGLRRNEPRVFRGIEWSSPRVLAQTRERAGESGLGVELLDELYDVDDPADLDRLARGLEAGEARCAHTAHALAELGNGYAPGAMPWASRREGG